MGSTVMEQSQSLRHLFQKRFTQICNAQDTVANLRPVVFDKYRYKGAEIERNARNALKVYLQGASSIEKRFNESPILVEDESGQGELALLLALMYPDRIINSYVGNEDGHRLLLCIIPNFVNNIVVLSYEEMVQIRGYGYETFIVSDKANEGHDVCPYAVHFQI